MKSFTSTYYYDASQGCPREWDPYYQRSNSYPSLRVQNIDAPRYADSTELKRKRKEYEEKCEECLRLRAEIKELSGEERLVGDTLSNVMQLLEKAECEREELRHFIATARIVPTGNGDVEQVRMMCRVSLSSSSIPSSPINVRVVGKVDSDMQRGDISCASPVGKALLGKRVGETITVKVKGKNLSYTILKIVA